MQKRVNSTSGLKSGGAIQLSDPQNLYEHEIWPPNIRFPRLWAIFSDIVRYSAARFTHIIF